MTLFTNAQIDQLSPDASQPPDRSIRSAYRRLAASQKSAKGSSLYSRYINRPAGRAFAAVAFRAGMTPNQVTLTSAACTTGALSLIATQSPSWPVGFAVGGLASVGYALDASDGQLARLRGGGSPAGEWLDHVLDCAKMVGMHTAILISFERFFDAPAILRAVPPAFQLMAVTTFFAGILTEQLKRRYAEKAAAGGEPTVPAGPPPSPSFLRAIALLPIEYGVFCMSLLLYGSQPAFVAGYVALFGAQAVLFPTMLGHWWRELRSL